MEKFYGTYTNDCFQMVGNAMKEALTFLKAK